MALTLASTGFAQAPNPFGVQDRADAARRMVVLGVQQGISSLPPTSGQSFSYHFDPEMGTYTASESLGPTSFRSPQVVGAGKLSLRLAISYFQLDDSFGPIDYKVSGINFPDPPGFCTRFGLDASAKVSLLNLAATYGLTDRLDVTLNVPLVVADVTATETFVTRDPKSDVVTVVRCTDPLDALLKSGVLSVARRDFADIRLAGGQSVDFQQGTNVGIGRSSVGVKFQLYTSDRFQVALAPEFFFPSPSQAEFAGSDSAAILGRIIGQMVVVPHLRLHADAGYDYDFDSDELRRITWNTGASVPFTVGGGDEASTKTPITADFGVGGSDFNKGITWTPSRSSFTDFNGKPAGLRALGDNQLGGTFVDFLAGLKARLTEKSVLSAAFNVPLNSQGFRADVVGTLAAEYYF